jgi:hypothetical protein
MGALSCLEPIKSGRTTALRVADKPMKQKLQFRTLKKNDYASISVLTLFFLGIMIPVFVIVFSFGVRPPAAQAALPGFISVGGWFAPGAVDIFTPTLFPPCGFPIVTVLGPRGGTFLWGVTQPYNWFAQAAAKNPPPQHVGLPMLGIAIPNPIPPCVGVPLLIRAGTGCSLIPGVRCDARFNF